MKKILSILCLLLVGLVGYGQIKQVYNQYGGRWLRSDDSLATRIPRKAVGVKDFNGGFDTAQIYYNPADSAVKVHTGFQWLTIGTGGAASIPPNIGSGHRIYSPQVPGFKTLFFDYGINGDSTTNANALTIVADSAELASYFLRRKDSVGLAEYATQFDIKDFVLNTRAINTGFGLIGGGNLSADRTLILDSAAVSGFYFKQAGNLFGATAVLGTNDNNALQFETNNVARGQISSGGLWSFGHTTAGLPFDYRYTNGSEGGLFRIQNLAAAGYSSLDFYDNAGVNKFGFGYANASTAINPGIGYINSTNVAFGIFYNAGHRITVDHPDGLVGINESVPTATMQVTGLASRIALLVKNAATTPGNIFELNTNGGSGGDLFRISSTGQIRGSLTGIPYNSGAQIVHLGIDTLTGDFVRNTSAGGGGSNHNILSATHTDAAVGTVARGDLITGQTATPAWTRLAKGTTDQFLQADANDVLWRTMSGDATLSAGAITIANDAVTFAKFQNISPGEFLGRTTAGSGDVEVNTVENALTFSANKLKWGGALTDATTTVSGAARTKAVVFSDLSNMSINAGASAPGNEIIFDSGGTGEMQITANNGALKLTWNTNLLLNLIANDNTEDKLLTWNSTTKNVEYRTVASLPGGGEANTASNLGGGLANFDSKLGVDLRFNTFAAADFDLASNLITIDATKWLTISSANTNYLSTSTTSTQDGYFGTIKLKDVISPSHYLTIRNNEDLTLDRTLNIVTGNATRTLTFTADATIGGTNTGDVTLAGETYLSIAGQVITANAVNLSGTHVTGTLAAARFGTLTGDVTTPGGSYATTIVSGAVLLNELGAAGGTNTINNAGHVQEWQWNSTTGARGLYLTSNSTGLSSGGSNGELFGLNLSGANANSGQTARAINIVTAKTGSSSTNYGIISQALNATTNIAASFAASGGTTNVALDLGGVSNGNGTIRVNGNTSGAITIQPLAAAGTYTLTLPPDDGTPSQVLTTDGGGTLTWTTPSGGGLGDPGGNGVVVRTALNTTINRTLTGTANQIVITNGDGVSANPTFDVGTDVAQIDVVNSWSDGIKQTFNPNATNAGINVGGQAGAPSTLANGDVWYDNTANLFKGRENGVTKDLISTGGVSDGIGIDINAGTANIIGVTEWNTTTTQTTTTSITTIATITTTSNTHGDFFIVMKAKKTDNSKRLDGCKIISWKNVAGTVTVTDITGWKADILDGFTTSTWTVTASGATLLIRATNEATENVDWTPWWFLN